MFSKTEIIFESDEHHALYCALFPENAPSAKTVSTVLVAQGFTFPFENTERLQIFSHFLKTEKSEKPEKTDADFSGLPHTSQNIPLHANPIEMEKCLHTLEQLRLSLIVNHEQVNFCFSALHPTPKNYQLQRWLHFYLDSPLKDDLAQGYWETLGKLKEKRLPLKIPSRIFVKAKGSSYLFCEWAQAHQYLQESSSTPIEFWELPQPISEQQWDPDLKTKEAYPPLTGATAALLMDLSKRIATAVDPAKKQLIAFGGSPQALLFFEARLKHFKVSFESLFSHQNETTLAASVIIFPFQSVPQVPHFKYWSFIDESFFSNKEKLSLTEAEMFTLMNAGFSIPRIVTDRDYLKAMLTHNLSNSENRLFLSSSAPKLELPEAEIITPTHIEPPSFSDPTLPPKTIRLSATQLENYAVCPTQYLVRYRLKLRPIQTIEDKYALLFGSAVHSTLESYFNSPATSLEDLFKTSLQSLSYELVPSHPLFMMMVQQFKLIQEHFFELEKDLKSQFGFTRNLALEKNFELEIEPFSFIGKMDRIIEREHSSPLVIDYKTGTVGFTPNQINQGEHYQALLYFLSLKKDSTQTCTGVLFYDLKKGELRRGLFEEPLITKELKSHLTRGHVLSSEKLEELLSVGTAHLIATSQQIQQGNFLPTPSTTDCPRCEAPTFCRKGLGYV